MICFSRIDLALFCCSRHVVCACWVPAEGYRREGGGRRSSAYWRKRNVANPNRGVLIHRSSPRGGKSNTNQFPRFFVGFELGGEKELSKGLVRGRRSKLVGIGLGDSGRGRGGLGGILFLLRVSTDGVRLHTEVMSTGWIGGSVVSWDGGDAGPSLNPSRFGC